MASVTDKLHFTQLKKIFSTSLPIKLICIAIILLYYLANMNSYFTAEHLISIPYFLKPPYLRLWTLVTASFVETRIVMVPVDIFCLLASAAVLEPIWGVSELLIFLAIISVGPISIIISFLFVSGLVVGENYAYKIGVNSAAGVLCGLTVALKQVRPDLDLSLVPPVSFRFKHLPFLCLLLNVVLVGFDLVEPVSAILSVTGLIVSWIYLRFFQRRESDLRGDPTDTFEFVTLFPETLHSCLNKFGSIIASFLRTIRLYPSSQQTYDLGVSSNIELLLPKTGNATTDRRKQKAQKDLEDRLSRTVAKSEEEWPDLLATESPNRDGELENVLVIGES